MRLALLMLLLPAAAAAHQPVFDMAPRWNGGYGMQLRYDVRTSEALKTDGRAAANPNGLRKRSSTLWWEGIYTFRRALRITLKVPHINKEERVLRNGVVRTLHAEGLGDVVLGMPVKKYFNRSGTTGNFSFTPSIFLPTGATHGDLPLGRGTADYGLGASLSVSTFRFYTLFDVFTRINTRGSDGVRDGHMLGFDVDLGFHPLHDNNTNSGVFVMVGLNGRRSGKDVVLGGTLDDDSGGRSFEAAPTLVLYKNNWMFRAQYHIPVLSRLNGTQLSQTRRIQAGVGVTFASFSGI